MGKCRRSREIEVGQRAEKKRIRAPFEVILYPVLAVVALPRRTHISFRKKGLMVSAVGVWYIARASVRAL